jgi:hypothetical protein
MTDQPLRFDTKIALLLRDDLATWQRVNVAAFLASGLGTVRPEVIGEPYADADGVAYLPMIRQPVLVLSADAAQLATSHRRAVERRLDVAVFIDEMFRTTHDAANRAAVAAVATAELPLAALAVFGPKNAVDKVTKGASMHG